MEDRGPGLCTGCGFALAPPTSDCRRCGSSADGVVWVEEPLSRRQRAGRVVAAIALLGLSPWGLVLLWQLAHARPEGPGDWVAFGLLAAVGVALLVAGTWLGWSGLELCFRREWTFHTVDERRRGAARTLWGRLVRGTAAVVSIEQARATDGAHALASQTLGFVGVDALWRHLGPALVALADGPGPGPGVVAGGLVAGDRREAELAVVAILFGMASRGHVALRLQRYGGWVKELGRTPPRPLPARYAVSLTTRGLTVDESGPLERALLEQAMLEQHLEDAVARAVGPRTDPWGAVRMQIADEAPAYLAVTVEDLASPLRALFVSRPEVAFVLWSAVERGLMKAAMAANDLWRPSTSSPRPTQLPN